MAKTPRVLVIGLDGVPFECIRDWARAGHLPTFARLMEQGVAGPLASTMPPTSGPSWTSFATGKNPGRTGIYDFLHRRPGSYVFPPVNARMRSGKSLWRLLGDAGRTTSVVNIPISYPVEEVNGVLISGWMTPYYAKDYTWPPELAAELEREIGNYRIYPAETFAEGRRQGFFDASDDLLDMLTRTNLHLMQRDPWDLFVTVYFDTDRILHQLWHYLDPEHPWRRGDRRSQAELEAPVIRYFARLDADIARLLEAAGPDTNVFVMSDHGMGRASRFVVLNNLLMERGWMSLARDGATRAKAAAFRAGFTLRNIHRIVDRLGLAKHAEYKNVYSFDALLKRFFLSFHNVDWSRTRAYSFGRHYGSVYLNVRGREPQGIVEPGADYERTREEIAASLLAYVDPELGRPLVREVLRREDVYSGEHFEEAPDLICLPEDPADIFFGLSDFGSNRIWDDTYRYSGMHRDHGLFFAAGPGVAGGREFAGGSVVDLAPTVLWMLGEEVPADMDGRPLVSAFSSEHNAAHPVRLGSDDGAAQSRGAHDYTDGEEAEIMERLRDLGYLN
jgi:predicted AlkP superfamily phosphohydrolase/phosphomutase